MLKHITRARLATAADTSSDAISETGGFTLSGLAGKYAASGVRDRLPLAVCILSVAFQEYPVWVTSPSKVFLFGGPALNLLGAGLLLCSLLAISARTSRLAVLLFIAIAAVAIIPDWAIIANHTYLALWAIPLALIFKNWWTSDLYAFYLRMTIGIVMLAAFSQKIWAGTYVDGSFIAWLSVTGSTTRRLFSFLCDVNPTTPCLYHQMIGIFILVWQFSVGVLLLLGLNSIIFLAVEIGFLLGAGVYADEMNFQILNIALLCVVFRLGMPLWLLGVSIVLLFVDVFTISRLLDFAWTYVR